MARQIRIGLLDPLQERILVLLLLRPKHEWYRSELARELGVTPSTLQRPLTSLVKVGIVVARQDGNRLYYRVDSTQPFAPELKSLLAKTSGVAGVVRDAFAGVAPKVRFAFVYGSVAAGTEHSVSDVDLLIVGTLGVNDIAGPLRKAAAALGREISPTVYSEREFKEKLRAGNRFLRAIMDKPRLFVIGKAHDVEEVAG